MMDADNADQVQEKRPSADVSRSEDNDEEDNPDEYQARAHPSAPVRSKRKAPIDEEEDEYSKSLGPAPDYGDHDESEAEDLISISKSGKKTRLAPQEDDEQDGEEQEQNFSAPTVNLIFNVYNRHC